MLLVWLTMIAVIFAAVFGALVLFTVYVLVRYRKVIYRIFEEKIPFLGAPPGQPTSDAENIWFEAAGGRKLAGSYLARRSAGPRRGTILFCHEFSANRWLYEPYVGYLRDCGFDVFTFDFCNHGDSESIEGYLPRHWVTEHEVEDVLAAIRYLKSRPDADQRGIGLFGVSKGGGAGIAAASRDPFVRGLVTDGAFPTHETVVQYELRWVRIFVNTDSIHWFLPRCFYQALCFYCMWRLQYRHNVKYTFLERSIRRLRGRPIFMIHGGSDNYINKDIVGRFFACARQPKELWVVPRAKHNCCLERAGDTYRDRVRDFFSELFGERLTQEPLPIRVGAPERVREPVVAATEAVLSLHARPATSP